MPSDYTALTFPPAPADRPYTILNMVTSLDGRISIDGTEAALTSPADHRLMRELRFHADVVLNGAETLRCSGASPRLGYADLDALRLAREKAPLPISATISRSGDLPLDRAFFTADDFEAIVYLSAACPLERRAVIEATGRPVVTVPSGAELPAMLAHMRQVLDASLLLLETGPRLNHQLFALDAVDEFFLTISPQVVGGDGQTAVAGASLTQELVRRFERLSAIPNPETGETYVRYRTLR